MIKPKGKRNSLADPFGEAGVFGGIWWVGVEDILDVGLAAYDVEGGDVGHGGEKADDGFVGLDIGHGPFGIGGVRVDAELLIDEALDAGLEAVFEAVLTSGDAVVDGAAGEIAAGKN